MSGEDGDAGVVMEENILVIILSAIPLFRWLADYISCRHYFHLKLTLKHHSEDHKRTQSCTQH